MYIYELPFDLTRELCRLLDMDDIWKELAGDQMKFSAFDVIEIEQRAKRQSTSATQQLFTKWGQLNHTVEELYILLYHMKHVPALRCLVSVVDERFHRLLAKLDGKIGLNKPRSNDENGNIKERSKTNNEHSSSIPLPVFLMQMQGGQTISAKNGQSHTNTSQSETSNTDASTNSTQSKAARSKSVEDVIAKEVCSIPKIDYNELTVATDNWSEANELGRGGFGQVFRGEWKCLPVAVKKLRDNDKLIKELIREMGLNHYRHDNILPLYGYSIGLGGREACLVYQLMTGGSLQQRLHRDKAKYEPLTWPQRYTIVHGVARGLQYLHNMDSKTPLIHGDIKPANILLDQCLMPKIGDFGLARKGPLEDKTHLKVSKPIGTLFYLPKEYRSSYVLSRALDTYSFGVVALETATARMPARKLKEQSQQYVHITTDIALLMNQGIDLASLEDPDLRQTPRSYPELCLQIISIGMNCTKDIRQDRPTMLEVYKQLDALEFTNKYTA